MRFSIPDFNISRQPDETTCGPTCLHSVLSFFGSTVTLKDVIDNVDSLNNGGTLSVMLANYALRKGFNATTYTYNLQLFDPTWFKKGVDLADKLKKQAEIKTGETLLKATSEYLKYLELGGNILYKDMSPYLIRKILNSGTPIICGLSSTYLYNSMREYGENCDYDDIKGVPSGHFVVVYGYDSNKRKVFVADPLLPNPRSSTQLYSVSMSHLICSILLGVLTYDSKLLIIEPPR
ncbi:MAG: hypothetical protein C0602_05595 [Denitrovibrio sp.]|nr:MAG: hypothetical protein C0602_05595 [Denitrovibrio sp.]